MRRLDEGGPDALLELPEPVNKYPEFVRYTVQRIQTLCPGVGKKQLAAMLARAGLHIATTTIGRIRKEQPHPEPSPKPSDPEQTSKPKTIRSKYPNHVWHMDLTLLPTLGGFWVPWMPQALLQLFPFCWWVALVIDNHSRRVMGFQLFRSQPTAVAIRAFLGSVVNSVGATPKYIVSDQGGQFANEVYKGWCKRRGIIPRFGALGEHGSIAVVERLFKTLKYSLLPGVLISLRRIAMHQTLDSVFEWYNEYRPHMTLRGRTPNEVYFKRFPANRKPRIEPRPLWPRGSPCAKPQALVAGQPGDRFTFEVGYHHGNRNLPIIALHRCA